MIAELLDAGKTNDLIHFQAIALIGRSHHYDPRQREKVNPPQNR
jgi:hypothetical protein